MKTMLCAAALALAALASSWAAAAEETENQCKVRLMTTTKPIVVGGNAVASFKPDSDPDSLEVVFLPSSDQSKSRVSDDGQVIYLNKATDAEMQALSLQAFDIRVKNGFCSRPPIKP